MFGADSAKKFDKKTFSAFTKLLMEPSDSQILKDLKING